MGGALLERRFGGGALKYLNEVYDARIFDANEAIGGLAVFLLGVETRRRALPDTVTDPQTTP